MRNYGIIYRAFLCVWTFSTTLLVPLSLQAIPTASFLCGMCYKTKKLLHTGVLSNDVLNNLLYSKYFKIRLRPMCYLR